MSNIDSLNEIAVRLLNENICAIPLDEKSLDTISNYMNYYIPFSDLCRRLSDIELNYVQISADADEACIAISEAKESIAYAGRKLTDHWSDKGYIQQIFFTTDTDDYDDVFKTYSTTLEFIKNKLSSTSHSLLVLSETAAQVRACAASFTEVYKESKLAIYAAMLNRDVESVLECRATSLQAHASAKECEKLSIKLLGNVRVTTKIINIINNMITEVVQWLNPDYNEYSIRTRISPIKANDSIVTAISLLDKLIIEK